MQWLRGIRAGIAVASVMIIFHLLGQPTGWITFGVLLVLNVDNGGPYRSRFNNMITVIVGGTLALVVSAIASISITGAILATSLFCFAITLVRVVSQSLASASSSILICYFVAYGAASHTSAATKIAILYFIGGGIWAAAFSLLFWPIDPFAPARNAVADIYATLASLATLPPEDSARFKDSVHRVRVLIETAENTLALTPARMTARTVRARNLTVMVQAADLLFARLLRLAELGAHELTTEREPADSSVADTAKWLAPSLRTIEQALRQRPVDDAAAFAVKGECLTKMKGHTGHCEAEPTVGFDPISLQLREQLAVIKYDCLLSLEVVHESLRAIWTGVEPRTTDLRSVFEPTALPSSPQIWLDALLSNFTSRSVIFRHALRIGSVAAADLLLLRLIHITHSYWMPMTSIIVLQPYTGETWRKSGDRIVGTIAGAILAAGLAAVIPSEAGIIAVISVGCIFALAVYAVDYAWYSFFITPAIVLLSQPQLGDWHFAAVRTGMTFIGALTALAAMLLLWPKRESTQLPALLARAAATDAAYLRALLQFWQQPASNLESRLLTGRTILSPARRACGLASNDAEDSLDRALLEQRVPMHLNAAQQLLNRDALTFTTYIRRVSQSITTLVTLGADLPALTDRVRKLTVRLDAVSAGLTEHNPKFVLPISNEEPAPNPHPTLVELQMIRIEQQIGILERTASDISANK